MDDDQLATLCRGAAPRCDAANRNLEAELVRSRLLARFAGAAQGGTVHLGRFELLRCLGRGGMGTVFEARDRAHGECVALKVLHDANGSALARLRREFRSLAQVSHPNLVALGELYEGEGQPYFTMELVPGRSLQAWLEQPPSAAWAHVERCLAQLHGAVSALHASGVVHGDLKPANLILRSDGRLVVVDFGLARALRDRECSSTSGTPAYMPPEQVRGNGASRKGDWYAVGSVLHDLLLAFADRAPPARRAQLQRACAGLLEPDPAVRFGANELAAALELRTRASPSFAPEEDGVFVGRRHELRALATAYRASVGAAAPHVVRVRGEAGIGKTALVERFLAAVEARGALVLRGRCYEQEVARYKGFDGVIEGLAGFLRALPEVARAELTPRDSGVLIQVFEGLVHAGFASHVQPPRAELRSLRRAAYAGLSALLGSIARQRALVLWLDDWHWSDPDGAALLEHVLRTAACPALVIVSQRVDAEASALPVCHDLALGPLSDPCATQLVRMLSGGVQRSAASIVTREAAGNPLHLRALVRALVRARPDSAAVGRDFRALVAAVVRELDPDARELLLFAALAAQPIGLDLLARAASSAGHPHRAVRRLKALRMLRSVTRGGSPALTMYHDRVRDCVVAELAPNARRARHRSLARAAEQLELDEPEFLAEQYLRGGEDRRAAPYAERAGDRARSAAALQQACTQYARALECHAPARPATLVAKLADAAALIGDVHRAAELFLEAARALPDRVPELQLRAAEMYLLAGARPEGMRLLQPALRAQGVWLPASELGASLFVLRELARVHLATPRARTRVRARPRDPRIDTAFRLGITFQLSAPIHGFALLLWSTARAQRHGSPAQRSRAQAQLAFTRAALGLGTEAQQDSMLDQALAETAESPVDHAYALASRALVGFSRCDCPATLASTAAARSFIVDRRVAVDWALPPLRLVEVSTQVVAGQFAQLRAAAAEVSREVEPTGNRALTAQVESAHAWACLVAGEPEPMQRYSERSMREWSGRRISPLGALAVWGEAHRRLYAGELEGAEALMRTEAPRLARAGLNRVHAWRVALLLLWGSVALARSRVAGDAASRTAGAHARALRCERARWAAPSAALLEAGIARRRNANELARSAYARACAGFRAMGMDGYAAAAAYRRAELAGARCDLRWFEAQAIGDAAAFTRMYAP